MVYIKCDRCGENSIKGTDEVYCTECYLKLRDEVIVLTKKIKELEIYIKKGGLL